MCLIKHFTPLLFQLIEKNMTCVACLNQEVTSTWASFCFQLEQVQHD